MTTTVPDLPQRGSFALVTYIPDLLGAFLDTLRSDLAGEKAPRAHITILPPRPLLSPLETVSLEAKQILKNVAAFRVRLSGVHSFPETNIVYLEIADGNEALHRLHDALNTGLLAHEENFEFEPHLTIGGPVELAQLASLRSAAEETWEKVTHPDSFQVSEVVALWQPPMGSQEDWDRVWSVKLGSGQSATAGVL